MAKKRKQIKVSYQKLGKSNLWGVAHHDTQEIIIDERAKGKKLLELLIHEAYHLIHPEANEEAVVKQSIILTNVLWKEGFRKVDNHDQIPLQDGTK